MPHPFHDRTDLDRAHDYTVARLLERMPAEVRAETLADLDPADRNLVEQAEERGWRDRNEYERDHGSPMVEPLDPAVNWAPWVERFRAATEDRGAR